MKNIKKYSVALASVAALGLMVAEPSFAEGGFGQVASTVEQSVDDFKTLAVQIGFFLGIVLFVIGMFLIYKDSKESGRGHLKNGLIAIVVGAGLLSMQTIITTTLETGGLETNGFDEEGFGGGTDG